ncbi:MAG TPA: TonB-dependent receptor plug domain-containing protein, partial [Hyphomicrobiaceae bacterium]|nr:TonB-dependent receptor plug domain-containing protein [Hyphomicrobiaceae bacterium]
MSLQISVSSQFAVRGPHSRSLPIVAVVAVAQVCCGVAYAQQSLPGIVVEGATLEQKPVRSRPAQPASAPQAAGTLPKSASAANAQGKAAPQASASQAASTSEPASEDAAGQGGRASQVAGVPVREIGTAVTVISRDEIERSKAQTFVDVVRAQPGVTVTQQGTAGTLTQVRLRGEDGKYTRVIVDGVDVSTTKDGAFDFSMLGADEIERVEIIRGPMSALYGSGAMGGVVNVITKAPRGPFGGVLAVEGGSFGTKRISGRVWGGGETSYLSIFGGLSDQSGYNISPFGTEKDGTRLATIGFKGGVSLSPDARLDVVVRHTEKRSEYDDFGADFVTPPAVKPFHTADDAANVLKQRQTLAGVRLAWDSFDGALTQTLKANYSRDNHRNR